MRLHVHLGTRGWSGSTRALAAVAKGLAARGHAVSFTVPPQSIVEERISALGIDAEPFAPHGSWMARGLALRRVLRERGVDVVFTASERDQLVAAAGVRFAGRGAVVRRLPAGATLALDRAGRFATRLAPTGFVFTTEAARDASRIPARVVGAAAIDLGVDVAEHDAARAASRASLGGVGATRIVVCVYDPSARTEAATVLRTVSLLAPRHPELRLALVGPGSDHEDLRMHAAALGITRITTHLGERDDQLAVLRAGDFGWVIAGQDNAAYAFLDFMALRIPVLTGRSAFAQHYVPDGITGVLLPSGDAPATAAMISPLFAHDDQRLAMGNAGRTRVTRDFTAARMVEGYEQVAATVHEKSEYRV